jgi:hypothetical protein
MSDTDWDNYRIYIVESIKTMKESLDKIENELKIQNIDNIKVFNSYKSEFENKLKTINDEVIKGNIKLTVITGGVLIVITSLVNLAIKYLT